MLSLLVITIAALSPGMPKSGGVEADVPGQVKTGPHRAPRVEVDANGKPAAVVVEGAEGSSGAPAASVLEKKASVAKGPKDKGDDEGDEDDDSTNGDGNEEQVDAGESDDDNENESEEKAELETSDEANKAATLAEEEAAKEKAAEAEKAAKGPQLKEEFEAYTTLQQQRNDLVADIEKERAKLHEMLQAIPGGSCVTAVLVALLLTFA